jgi:tRNA threonylcarbamoyladenosine biosynthesis protein TsaB
LKILAIDTTSEVASCAVLQDTMIVSSFQVRNRNKHSVHLLPMVQNVMEVSGFSIRDIDYFACCVGPGSFTGIRIGITTIKAFAYCFKKPVVAVSSIEGLVRNYPPDKDWGYCSMIDARNHQAYYGFYRFREHEWIEEISPQSDQLEKILAVIQNRRIKTYFLGSGSVQYQAEIQSASNQFQVVEEHYSSLDAGTIGRLAYNKVLEKKILTAESLVPLYVRKSQAERARLKVSE